MLNRMLFRFWDQDGESLDGAGIANHAERFAAQEEQLGLLKKEQEFLYWLLAIGNLKLPNAKRDEQRGRAAAVRLLRWGYKAPTILVSTEVYEALIGAGHLSKENLNMKKSGTWTCLNL